MTDSVQEYDTAVFPEGEGLSEYLSIGATVPPVRSMLGNKSLKESIPPLHPHLKAELIEIIDKVSVQGSFNEASRLSGSHNAWFQTHHATVWPAGTEYFGRHPCRFIPTAKTWRSANLPCTFQSLMDSLVTNASMSMEIIAILRLSGMVAIANRLSSLRQITDNDPDETPMNIESLRYLALFLLSEHEMGGPQIGVNPDGTLGATWRMVDHIVVDLEFLPNSLVRLAALGPRTRSGSNRQRVSGLMNKEKAVRTIRSFISRDDHA